MSNFIIKMVRKPFGSVIDHYKCRLLSRWAVLSMDFMIVLFVFCLICVIRKLSFLALFSSDILLKMAVVLVFYIIAFFMSKTYHGIIRHAGFNDVVNIVVSSTLVGVLYIFAKTAAIFFPVIQRMLLLNSEMIFEIALVALLMILMRTSIKYVYNEFFVDHKIGARNVVIYGAGSAGIIARNALLQDLHYRYHIVSYVDEDSTKVGKSLNAIPIYSPEKVLSNSYIQRKSVDLLIIAIPTISIQHKQDIIEKGLELGLKVQSVPHIDDWINGTFSSNQLQNIKIEDLLEREQIVLEKEHVIQELKDKVVMITGAAGSIGSEIARQVLIYNPKLVIMLDQAESPMYDFQFELRNASAYKNLQDKMVFVIANVKDANRMEEIFCKYRPDIVYHAAAYKHVPFMEENPYEAILVNVFGTRTVAQLAIKYETRKFVMISTDKAVNPTNVMGATKRVAEIFTQSHTNNKTHFVTTRFGNVLGSNGSVIPLFRKQLEKGGPLTITHRDIIRYFMTIPEACSLVLEASAMGTGGDIFVFDMGKPVRIYDLAKNMIRLSKMEGVEIKEIGLRPGEKLYEELLATKENTIQTSHPKIMRAKVREYDLEEVDHRFSELYDALQGCDDFKLVAKLKQIVPEFVSNNSIFSALDKKS